MSFGTISAFLVYVNLFQSPMGQIAQSINSLQSGFAASARVFDFLGEEELSSEEGVERKLLTDENSTIQGEVRFEHIDFSYDPSRQIIHDWSADVKPGMKVALVGPTGAGKTTMVNLLMRFYEVDKGSIKIDGISSKDMPREEVHDIFGMVLQDTWLFEGSVRENLVYNSKNVSDEDIYKVLRDVDLEHYIRTLPGGLDYVITDANAISSGEKQLLTIARAMLKKSPLLILDEATSNVDTRTEERIQKAMDKLMEGRTSFVIAHRLSTIRNADLILVMKDGAIIEQGNHDALMEQNGFYAGLYNAQFAFE
jgi:ATP-binding cassette subfamily B protein